MARMYQELSREPHAAVREFIGSVAVGEPRAGSGGWAVSGSGNGG